MQGYISIHRKIKEWRHYKEPAVKAVFLDLLLDAAHKTTVQSGVRLAVGECISSTRTLAANNGLTVNTVTKVIRLLVESGEFRDMTNKQRKRFMQLAKEYTQKG